MNPFDDTFNGLPLERNFVYDLHQREFVKNVPGGKQSVRIPRRDRPLQFLSVQQLRFDPTPQFFAGCRRYGWLRRMMIPIACERRRAFAVPSTVASRDKIRHAAGFGEGVVGDAVEEHVTEFGHFSQSDTQQCRFRVGPQPDPVDETGTERDDVFQGTANFGAGHVRDVIDSKVRRRIEQPTGQLVGRRTEIGRQRRFAHLSFGDFVRDVRAHQYPAREVVPHRVGYALADQYRLSRFFAKIDPFDQGYAPTGRMRR